MFGYVDKCLESPVEISVENTARILGPVSLVLERSFFVKVF